MKRSLSPAVRQMVHDIGQHDTDRWYDQDLSIDELTDTVAAINGALRAMRAL